MSMSDEKESLFSLEVAVKTVYLKHAIICRVPKVSVRMLEYPPLELKLFTDDEFGKIKEILEKEPETVAQSPQILQFQHSTGTYVFTQGKSMLIKDKLSHLEERLLNVPVYVMVIDILPTIPKLVASFALSLEGSIRKIVQSVSLNGIEIPCAHGERDIFPLYNLMGSKVGEAEMGVRLSSLGVNMLHHVSNIAEPEAHHAVPFPVNIEVRNDVSKKIDPSNDQKVLKFKESFNSMDDKNEEDKENMGKKRTLMMSGSTQTAFPKMHSKSVQYPIFESEEALEKENVYCPPALYYDKRSEALEKELHLKQHNVNAEVLQQHAQSITLADLQTNSPRKVPLPSRAKFTPSKSQGRTKVDVPEEEDSAPRDAASALADFPILKALVEEVTRLGCKEKVSQPSKSQQKIEIRRVEDKRKTPKRVAKPRVAALHKSSAKVPEPKGPLKFGLTHTMRLRMAMNKSRDTQDVSKLRLQHPRGSMRSSAKSTSDALGRTFTVKTPRSIKPRKMVSTACGPDDSMYRRVAVKPQTVYMGKMGGYEEGTDHDVPSIDHATPEVTDDYIEDLMIVKDIATPRAHSRQSQRSIEIHLPTASTEFTIGKDDDPDWASTFSDKERLFEKHRNKVVSDEDDPELYTPPESVEASRPGSVTEVHKTKKVVTISQSLEKSDLGSDMYKYSDDFEDDKTWSANRTPSVVTPVASSLVVNEEDELLHRDSMDKNAVGKTSLTNADHNTINFAQMSSVTSDEAATSSESGGSVVTARTTNSVNGKKRTIKYGTKAVPEPIQCDSPVTQSIDTESGERGFPDPSQISLTGIPPRKPEANLAKEDKLPKASAGNQGMAQKRDVPPPKPSRFTPSPPMSRRSPLSSPESSRDKLRRMFRHPGRRHRHASSESISSDFEKPVSPVRRSDSVSSYIPSDLSEISNIRMSEDLSDILSEDTGDSQDESRSVKKKNYMPKDGPKTYFGMPKLDPSNKLAYTK